MKPQRSNRLKCFAMAMCIGLLACSNAMGEIFWDANGGIGGDWHEPLNWTGTAGDPDNAVPTSTNAVVLSSRCSADNPVVIAGQQAEAASLIVGPRFGAVNYIGYLLISNDLTLSGGFTLHEKGNGYVVHEAGVLSCSSFTLASSTTVENGTGIYRLSESGSIHATGNLSAIGGTGTVLVQSGADTVVQIDGGVTSGNTSPGVPWCYRLESGSLTISGSVSRVYGAWRFEQSGGSAVIGGSLNLGTGYRSPGTHGQPFEWIVSGDASLSIGKNVQLGCTDLDRTVLTWGRFTLQGCRANGGDVQVGESWRQTGTNTVRVVGTRGVLKAVIDDEAQADAGSMRKVVVTTGAVTFDSGSMVQPEFDPGTTPSNGTWTLMTWPEGKVTDNGLCLEPSVDPQVWSFSVTPTGLNVHYRGRSTLITVK